MQEETIETQRISDTQIFGKTSLGTVGDIFRLIPTMWEDGMETCSRLSLHFAAHNLYVGEVSILHIFQRAHQTLHRCLPFFYFHLHSRSFPTGG